jgi:methylthioribose-1-phosphate isomerase
MIDQRDLPAKFDIVPHTQLAEVVNSIKIMLVRGAPAIGAAGGTREIAGQPRTHSLVPMRA